MANSTKAKATIAKRQELEKPKLIDQLKKTPIIQIACEKAGIGRATYYRWLKDDHNFAEAANDAIRHGSDLVNDMAESQLMAAIRERNLTAIIFWLKHHHPSYVTKIELDAKLQVDKPLSPEAEKLIRTSVQRGILPTSALLTIQNYEQSPSDTGSVTTVSGIIRHDDQEQESSDIGNDQ
jgi:hypothetical protein